jgi:hypothetical protein
MKKVIWALVVIALGVGAYFMFKPAEEAVEAPVVEETCSGSCADCAGGCDSTALCASCDSTAVAE